MRKVNKVIYLVLAFLLGTFGVHKFYAGQKKTGLFYLLFCWTCIPTVCSLYDLVVGLFKPEDEEGNITFS
ncbi:MAG: TM2 domain-containing protein [Candidatus Bruticola sp.]